MFDTGCPSPPRGVFVGTAGSRWENGLSRHCRKPASPFCFSLLLSYEHNFLFPLVSLAFTDDERYAFYKLFQNTLMGYAMSRLIHIQL
jgi:hypothetical protein